MNEQQVLINVPPHNGNVDENQRYTIRRAREWCLKTAGVDAFDLDTAACREAHHAPYWYGLDHEREDHRDGLAAPWFGSVICNPPWDNIEPWVEKAWRSFSVVSPVPICIAMLIPGDRTHRPWWQRWVEPFRDGRDVHGEGHPLAAAPAVAGWPMPTLDVHFAPERFPYGGPGNPEGIGAPEPNFTSALLVWWRS